MLLLPSLDLVLDILQITNNPTNLCILLRTPLTLPLLPISTLLLLLFTPILLILLTVCFFLPLPPYLIHPNPFSFPPPPKVLLNLTVVKEAQDILLIYNKHLRLV